MGSNITLIVDHPGMISVDPQAILLLVIPVILLKSTWYSMSSDRSPTSDAAS
jgi:hypothetical protein